ncbi:helix-turn-helix domain-containing protein [Secundilactobacillus mixtipabuli]|uniref:HTH cro/C1-type domain-containing protein n=1 Tax=Secundilactobacillus mixtipabuli TaxID=1435342 RepID=A0A1Z5IBU7_9LACO|nr:helix-turn-helix domain-containing protein [Secundilactobacillus mixtipabuli]GAW99098.1 hypothetical protein IWT30_01058 [Secundilactobacillus mixtipabuli]
MARKKEFYNPELEITEIYTEVWRSEIVKVRDINDLIVRNHYWEDASGELWGDFDDPMENVRNSFNAYRERQGYLTPDDIRTLRQKLGLSVRQFANELGIGSSTLTQIENNQRLQVKYQEKLFRAAEMFYQNGQWQQFVNQGEKPLIMNDLNQGTYYASEDVYQTQEFNQNLYQFKGSLGDVA